MRVTKALEGFAGFGKLILGGMGEGFDMLVQALALEGFGKLLKSLGWLWEALASTYYVPPRLSEGLGNSGSLWENWIT